MKVKLFHDLHHHVDGKVVKYKAGETPDLPRHIAEFVNNQVVKRRERIRRTAERFSFTPEAKRK